MPEIEPPSLETCARVQWGLSNLAKTDPVIWGAPGSSDFRLNIYNPVYQFNSSDSLVYEDVVQVEVLTCLVVEVGIGGRRHLEANYKGVRFRQPIEFFTKMELLSAILLSPREEVFRVTPREDAMLSDVFSSQLLDAATNSRSRILTVYGRTIEVI